MEILGKVYVEDGILWKMGSVDMKCVSTGTFSMKLNREPLSYFTSTRGTKQGDLLSPYLLILVVNCLLSLMKNVVNTK